MLLGLYQGPEKLQFISPLLLIGVHYRIEQIWFIILFFINLPFVEGTNLYWGIASINKIKCPCSYLKLLTLQVNILLIVSSKF